jgi:hypothetical protein
MVKVLFVAIRKIIWPQKYQKKTESGRLPDKNHFISQINRVSSGRDIF